MSAESDAGVPDDGGAESGADPEPDLDNVLEPWTGGPDASSESTAGFQYLIS